MKKFTHVQLLLGAILNLNRPNDPTHWLKGKKRSFGLRFLHKGFRLSTRKGKSPRLAAPLCRHEASRC